MLPPSSLALPDPRAGFCIEGRGRPIVLVHGTTGANGAHRALIERMRRSHRMIAIELPMAPTDALALVESVLRVGLLPGERFHCVGHADGAAAALALARARPWRLHSLTLFEPVALEAGASALEALQDEALRRRPLPTCLLSAGLAGPMATPAPAQLVSLLIAGFIRGVDALELPVPSRVAQPG